MPLPCSGSDSAMTNLQSGSFLSTEGSAMPTLLHFQYSMAVRRSPMPSWSMTKPSFTSSSLPGRTNSQLDGSRETTSHIYKTYFYIEVFFVTNRDRDNETEIMKKRPNLYFLNLLSIQTFSFIMSAVSNDVNIDRQTDQYLDQYID